MAEPFWKELHDAIGAWSPGTDGLLLAGPDLLDPSAVFEAADLKRVSPELAILERWVSERDWVRKGNVAPSETTNRIAFFGVKGGVGRSTALSATARHLAEKGKRVVVIDLDLESPGVSALLLPGAGRPRYGVVDWFVEAGVDQANEDLLVDMVATSPLAAGTAGEIRVVPAAGEAIDTYVSKLARVQTSSVGKTGFAASLDSLLRFLEESEQPSVVLIDCRAGIDDLAASVLTGLATDSLLFAIGTPQTWLAYRMLFSAWGKDPNILAPFRDRLRIIGGLIPETEREEYFARLRGNAYDLFAEYIYDEEVDAAESRFEPSLDLFNFDLNDDTAPHSPVPVFWRREFQDWDPVSRPGAITGEQMAAAFAPLTAHVDELIGAQSEETKE